MTLKELTELLKTPIEDYNKNDFLNIYFKEYNTENLILKGNKKNIHTFLLYSIININKGIKDLDFFLDHSEEDWSMCIFPKSWFNTLV